MHLTPFYLLDGVELTGALSFTVSGSKDKLLNTHAEVTYVSACLPDSFSSPTCSISPSLSCFPCFHPALIFSFCPREYNEFLLTANRHCAIELASFKCTKLHSSSKTDLIFNGSPGAYTLNGTIDYFNPACLLCVKDNNLLSYLEITYALRNCNIVQLYCRTTKVLSNIDAPSSYSH